MSQYQKGKTNLDFTEARDSEWQWHQLGHMQVCTLLQTDNHASTSPLSFLQAGCPSCHPTNSVKALKANESDDALYRFTVYTYVDIIFVLAAKLGANAILGVSLAVCKAGAAHKVELLFRFAI